MRILVIKVRISTKMVQINLIKILVCADAVQIIHTQNIFALPSITGLFQFLDLGGFLDLGDINWLYSIRYSTLYTIGGQNSFGVIEIVKVIGIKKA